MKLCRQNEEFFKVSTVVTTEKHRDKGQSGTYLLRFLQNAPILMRVFEKKEKNLFSFFFTVSPCISIHYV
jgi:hypothetical protein